MLILYYCFNTAILVITLVAKHCLDWKELVLFSCCSRRDEEERQDGSTCMQIPADHTDKLRHINANCSYIESSGMIYCTLYTTGIMDVSMASKNT